MTETPLADLLDDTDAQLSAALAAVAAGELIDLGDLPPRIETLCRRAIAARDRGIAKRLAPLINRLDALDRALRARIAAISPEDTGPDPKRASQLYRAAANPTRDESQG
jgi:hypothetical protein